MSVIATLLALLLIGQFALADGRDEPPAPPTHDREARTSDVAVVPESENAPINPPVVITPTPPVSAAPAPETAVIAADTPSDVAPVVAPAHIPPPPAVLGVGESHERPAPTATVAPTTEPEMLPAVDRAPVEADRGRVYLAPREVTPTPIGVAPRDVAATSDVGDIAISQRAEEKRVRLTPRALPDAPVTRVDARPLATELTEPYSDPVAFVDPPPAPVDPPPPAPSALAGAAPGWVWPAAGVLTQDYGCSPYTTSAFNPVANCHFHFGLDIANATGTPIVAAGPGTVVWSGWREDGLGFAVFLDHGGGVVGLYGHLAAQPHVVVGQWVEPGQYLGQMGSTGYSTGPHLHFEMHRYGQPINPREFLGW